MANNNLNTATNTLMDSKERTYTFKKSCVIKGVNYSGSFTAKMPSIADRINIGVTRAKILDGAKSVSVDNFTDDIIFMTAFLDSVLTSKPKWFDFNAFDDIGFLREVYIGVSNWIESFQLRDHTDSNADNSTATPNEETMESN